MELSPEEIEKVAEYADLLLTIPEIAILLEKDVYDFKDEFEYEKGILHKTYMKAALERKVKLRRPILKMAEMGSPNAETIAHTYLSDHQIFLNET